eukprot:TRINITY_DN4580_c0_g1_i1.p1 TRINITY_DN4580_c0_g1~~TRINITY_DN4580_c0_g1_i1.p1  ORF type:complete len:340 (-),score=50.52 TRINITY_DN4580_c0_g1_i1:73-1002(-)
MIPFRLLCLLGLCSALARGLAAKSQQTPVDALSNLRKVQSVRDTAIAYAETKQDRDTYVGVTPVETSPSEVTTNNVNVFVAGDYFAPPQLTSGDRAWLNAMLHQEQITEDAWIQKQMHVGDVIGQGYDSGDGSVADTASTDDNVETTAKSPELVPMGANIPEGYNSGDGSVAVSASTDDNVETTAKSPELVPLGANIVEGYNSADGPVAVTAPADDNIETTATSPELVPMGANIAEGYSSGDGSVADTTTADDNVVTTAKSPELAPEGANTTKVLPQPQLRPISEGPPGPQLRPISIMARSEGPPGPPR